MKLESLNSLKFQKLEKVQLRMITGGVKWDTAPRANHNEWPDSLEGVCTGDLYDYTWTYGDGTREQVHRSSPMKSYEF